MKVKEASAGTELLMSLTREDIENANLATYLLWGKMRFGKKEIQSWLSTGASPQTLLKQLKHQNPSDDDVSSLLVAFVWHADSYSNEIVEPLLKGGVDATELAKGMG